MPTWVFMPKLGINMTRGVILNWLVGEGEAIKKGQPIVEIETDKAAQQVEAPETGVLARVVAKVGESVPCTYVIAAITQVGESLPAQIPLKDEESVVPEASFAGDAAAPMEGGPAALHEGGEPGAHAVISPAARKLAEELGVDYRKVRGSGGRGRIQKADILAAAESLKSGSGAPPVQLAPSTPASSSSPASGDVIAIRGVRALIAERMLQSAQGTARVVLMTEVDATQLVAWRDQLRRKYPDQGRTIGYTELLVFLTARALCAFPYMNASQRGDAIHLLTDINVGVAVDTDRGLLVPVIHHADRKGVLEIQTELARLAEMARKGQIPPDDLTGGTFTLTNLGMWEIDAFTPVINPPEIAILGVGQIAPRPAAFGQQVIVQQRTTLSLAFDHRLVDGAPAARFLQRIKQWIEAPSMLIGG
jgi:pyruvate dehydrogenase E2 component (dihydrolipoamide acetyltransferase)